MIFLKVGYFFGLNNLKIYYLNCINKIFILHDANLIW